MSTKLITAAPGVVNLGSQLWVQLPINNVGTAIVTALTITNIALGSTPLLSPTSFPVIEGTLNAPDTISVGAAFDATRLTVGESQLLTVRGTYLADGQLGAFALNQIVTVPQPESPAITLLQARITSAVTDGRWSYTVANSEPTSSTYRVSAIAIDISSPVTIAATPAGWSVRTDNLSYVLWYTTNAQNQILPGQSLGGFQLISNSGATSSVATKATITSWDSSKNAAGPVNFLRVPTPAP